MTSSATRGESQALPWLVALYAAASLLHFVHNAEHLAHYPNLPSSWSRVDVYLAWCVVTTLGIVGYVLYLRGNRRVGLSFFGPVRHPRLRWPPSLHSRVLCIPLFDDEHHDLYRGRRRGRALGGCADLGGGEG
jgi:hypothetical protein